MTTNNEKNSKKSQNDKFSNKSQQSPSDQNLKSPWRNASDTRKSKIKYSIQNKQTSMNNWTINTNNTLTMSDVNS